MSATIQSISGGGGSLKPISSFEDELENGWATWVNNPSGSVHNVSSFQRQVINAQTIIFDEHISASQVIPINYHYTLPDFSSTFLCNVDVSLLLVQYWIQAGSYPSSPTVLDLHADVIINGTTFSDDINDSFKTTSSTTAKRSKWFDIYNKTFGTTLSDSIIRMGAVGPTNFAKQLEVHVTGTITTPSTSYDTQFTVQSGTVIQATGGFSF